MNLYQMTDLEIVEAVGNNQELIAAILDLRQSLQAKEITLATLSDSLTSLLDSQEELIADIRDKLNEGRFKKKAAPEDWYTTRKFVPSYTQVQIDEAIAQAAGQ
jgi:hypothetical protein